MTRAQAIRELTGLMFLSAGVFVGGMIGGCLVVLAAPESYDAPETPTVDQPVIIDTINVFDIYQPPIIVHEPVVFEDPPELTEEVVSPDPIGLLVLSDEELDMAARIVHAEAGNKSKEGRRLVADVLLNRRDSSKFPNDIVSIVKQSGQFSTYRTGAYLKYEPTWDDYDTVILELDQRIDDSVLYFNCNNYISGTTPLYKFGDHYFSK